MPPILSAIVVAYENQPFPDPGLDSLVNQLRLFHAELILVNAGSDDPRAAFQARYGSTGFPVREVESRVKGAPAVAMNRGADMAEGEYLLMLGRNVALHPEALELMIDYIRSDRSVGMVVPQVVNPAGNVLNSCRRFPTHKDVLARAFGFSKLFPHSRFWNGWLMGDFPHQQTRRVEGAIDYAWLLSASAWNKVGRFDDNFRYEYYDTDWCRRLRELGYVLLFYPQARVVAAGTDDEDHLVRRQVSLFRLFDKYYDGVHHQILNLLVGLVIYLTLPLRLLWRSGRKFFARSR